RLLVGVGVSSTGGATQRGGGELTTQLPAYQGQSTRTLVRIVEARTASGVLGTVVLVPFSTPLFGASRLVLHRLLGVRVMGGVVRNFLGNFVTDAALVATLSILLFVTTTVSWMYHGLQKIGRAHV